MEKPQPIEFDCRDLKKGRLHYISLSTIMTQICSIFFEMTKNISQTPVCQSAIDKGNCQNIKRETEVGSGKFFEKKQGSGGIR